MQENHPSVLVIDGKQVSRKIYTKLVRQFFSRTHKVLEAESGIKGLILSDRKEPDCVLTAYHLPDMDALQFLEKLSERLGKNRHVPVVIISIDDDEQTAIRAMKLGAHDYFIKGKFSPVMMAQSIKNAIENAQLTREVHRGRQQLLDSAHKAGMAEIATGVLHNIGNNLNSVATAVDAILNTVDKTKLKGLTKANELLASLQDRLADHPKGSKLVQYYESLDEIRESDLQKVRTEAMFLLEKISLIRNDVQAQTAYANQEFFVEELDVNRMVEEAISLQKGRLDDESVIVRKSFSKLPKAKLVRVKFLQILNNLVKNSLESFTIQNSQYKVLTFTTMAEGQDFYKVTVGDNGIGIPPDDQESIFNYGFTSKEDCQGIGLHVAANAATELGGSLLLEKSEPNRGASFTLALPFKGRETKPKS